MPAIYEFSRRRMVACCNDVTVDHAARNLARGPVVRMRNMPTGDRTSMTSVYVIGGNVASVTTAAVRTLASDHIATKYDDLTFGHVRVESERAWSFSTPHAVE